MSNSNVSNTNISNTNVSNQNSNQSFSKTINQITKNCAHVNQTIRLQSLENIENSLSNSSFVKQLSLVDCRKLWKGIMKGFHLADGDYVFHQEWASRIAKLVWLVVVSPSSDDQFSQQINWRMQKLLYWTNAFYFELVDHFKTLDRFRQSKFMSLARFFLNETIKLLYLYKDVTIQLNQLSLDTFQSLLHPQPVVNLYQSKKSPLPEQFSTVHAYNHLMSLNLLFPSGLHTSEILVFHIENIAPEFAKVIAQLDQQTNILTEDQIQFFILLLSPYIEILANTLSESIQKKISNDILDRFIADESLSLLCGIKDLLKSHASNRAEQYIAKYEAKIAALQPNPLQDIEKELEQVAKLSGERRERRKMKSQKKQERKLVEKKQEMKQEEKKQGEKKQENRQKQKKQEESKQGVNKEKKKETTGKQVERTIETSIQREMSSQMKLQEKKLEEKRRVSWSLQSNKTKLYSTDGIVEKRPLDWSIQPQKGILKRSSVQEKTRKRKRGAATTTIEHVPTNRIVKKLRRRAQLWI